MTDSARPHAWTRRTFLTGLTGAGAATLVGAHATHANGEPPPETTTIRPPFAPAPCTAPQYVAEELLRAEGFTAVRYVKSPLGRMVQVAADRTDIGITFAGPIVLQLDAGDPMVALAASSPP